MAPFIPKRSLAFKREWDIGIRGGCCDSQRPIKSDCRILVQQWTTDREREIILPLKKIKKLKKLSPRVDVSLRTTAVTWVKCEPPLSTQLCSLLTDSPPPPVHPSTHTHTHSRSASPLLQHVSGRQPLFINRGVSFPAALPRPPVFQIKYLSFDVRRMEDVSSSFPYWDTNTV